MSLIGIEKNLNKIKKLGEEYDNLLKERKELETKIEGLKAKYEEGRYGRDVFSEHNKKLSKINENIIKIREKVRIFSGNISKEVDEEIKNVK